MIGRPPNFRTRVRLDGPTRQAIETGRTRLLVTGATFAIAFAAPAGHRLFGRPRPTGLPQPVSPARQMPTP